MHRYLWLVALALMACDDDYLPTATTTPSDSPLPNNQVADWCTVRAKLSRPKHGCIACHDQVSPVFGNLDLTGDAYAKIVNVPSAEYAGRVYVVPSKPEMSFMLTKMEGKQDIDEGSRMPLGSPWAQADIDLFRKWIAHGAQRACVGDPDYRDTGEPLDDTGAT